ncbi:hypothetical protein [Mycobacterium sp. URHB0021]|jgi:hypothetical protein
MGQDVDLTIGTSAGSIVGSYVSARTVTETFTTLSGLAPNPAAMAEMVVTDTGADPQRRATGS